MSSRLNRFAIRGVVWRELLASCARNLPSFTEPWMVWWWSAFFLFLWPAGRRDVMRNYAAIFPRDSWFRRLMRTYSLFVNFAWTFEETMRFQEKKTLVDWELEGLENFRELEKTPGAIILTAHMGNYDLGAYFFTEKMKRPLHVVRVPEQDQMTEAHSSARRTAENLTVSYNTSADALAIDLLTELRNGRFVAIQGDRVVGNVARITTTLFGQETELPSGPFALATIARVPLFPLFVVRTGFRSYRVIVRKKIECLPTGRARDAAIRQAMNEWRLTLESIIRSYWFQWFVFKPFMKDAA